MVGAFGRHLQVRDLEGRVHAARPFGRKLSVICGDRVRCAPDAAHGDTHVTEVYPRRTCLYRANQRGGAEPVCANLTLLLVAIAFDRLVGLRLDARLRRRSVRRAG